MLHGTHIVLRPIEVEDLPRYVRWFADSRVLEYFGPFRPMNLAQERAWWDAQNSDRSAVNFACEFEGRHIGGGGFCGIDHMHRRAEVGLCIGEPDLWDRGLGTDMLRTLLAYGFDYLNLHRVSLRVFAENMRALHAYERLGFVHEGRFREAEWRHGKWHDLLLMSILSREWAQAAGRPL